MLLRVSAGHASKNVLGNASQNVGLESLWWVVFGGRRCVVSCRVAFGVVAGDLSFEHVVEHICWGCLPRCFSHVSRDIFRDVFGGAGALARISSDMLLGMSLRMLRVFRGCGWLSSFKGSLSSCLVGVPLEMLLGYMSTFGFAASVRSWGYPFLGFEGKTKTRHTHILVVVSLGQCFLQQG